MDSTDKFRPLSLKVANLLIGWRGQWLGVFGLAIFAIFTWLPNSYTKMVDWPWIMGWQIGFLAIGAFGFWMLRRFKTPFKPLGYGLDGAVGLLILVILSSSATAEFPEVAALNSILCLFYVAALYIFHNWVQHSPITHRSPWLWLWLCGVGSITSIVSLALWRPTKEMWLSSNFDDAIRNGLPLGHHNFMGGYLILTFPLITTFALTQTRWKKWLGFAISALSIIALYTTGSRGAWIGSIVIVLTTIIVLVNHSQGPQRRKALAISAITLCVIFLALFSNPRIRSMVTIKSATDIFSYKQAFVLDGPTKDRWFMAQAAKNIVEKNPFLGVGPGNLARVYNLYRPIEAGTGLELVQQLHSLPLQILGELGLLGLAAYIWTGICLLRLWLKLASANLQDSNRYLLYGIGASFLGYGISSLTDYQLENIGIASTLLLLTLLLIGIANQEHLDSQDNTSDFSIRLRRILSLALLGLLGLAIKFWMPIDIAMYFSHSAAANLISGNIATADTQWAKAAAITPWDPVPNALAGQAIVDILGSIDLEEKAEILHEQAVSDYKAALKAAPNDAWFNNNLAILYLPTDDRQAEYFASRAIQLAPRTQHYLYFTLGLSYLSQNKRQLAIQAFALECLENPTFISMDLWEQAPFDSVRSETIAQATDYYEQLLTLITPDSSQYNQLYEQRVLMRWWHHLDNPNIEMKRIRPLLQAVFLAESQPKRSLKIIENQIQNGNDMKGMKLVRAWIDPQKYLNEYLSSEDIDNAEKSLLQEHIEKQTSLKSWFQSVVIPSDPGRRYGLSFAYRNADANYIISILQPGALNQSMIANVLGIFSQMPREFPELEQLMETIRTQKLGLQHPTQNGFQLVSPSDLHK